MIAFTAYEIEELLECVLCETAEGQVYRVSLIYTENGGAEKIENFLVYEVVYSNFAPLLILGEAAGKPRRLWANRISEIRSAEVDAAATHGLHAKSLTPQLAELGQALATNKARNEGVLIDVTYSSWSGDQSRLMGARIWPNPYDARRVRMELKSGSTRWYAVDRLSNAVVL